MVLAILTVYRFLLLLVLVLGAPFWLIRLAFSPRFRAGLKRRLGMVPARVGMMDVRRDIVWVHAVSVGEVIAASELVRALSDAGCLIAVSTTTRSGQELARKRFKNSVVFYMPLDAAWIVRRYLRAMRPRLVVMMESELWPNLIHTCAASGIPLAVANARVSDRSFPRYLRLRPVWKPLLREVSLFLAQSEETASRLLRMGVLPQRIVVAGNVKYDVRTRTLTPLTRATRALTPLPIVVAGSTLPGEEEAVLNAFAVLRRTAPDTILLLAPRHKERFDSVRTLLQKSGNSFLLCSQIQPNTPPLASGTVLLLDTIGDLASMYSLATAAFVGGSLVEKGGHNPLEPAQYGVPVLMGKSYENFREIVDALRTTQALQIVTAEQLGPTLAALLADPAHAHSMGERGRQVFEAQAGATGRMVARLLALLRRVT